MVRIASFLFIIFLLYSCTDTNEVLELNPTELEVKVLDDQGLTVPNAEVRIFRNERDWKSLSREVDIQGTDENGVAHFTNLLPFNYYFFASFERNGQLVTNQYVDEFGYLGGTNYDLADFLTENAITRVSVSATSTRLLVDQIDSVILFSTLNLIYIGKNESLSVPSSNIQFGIALINNYSYSEDLETQIINSKADYSGSSYGDFSDATIGDEFYFGAYDQSAIGLNELGNHTLVLYSYDNTSGVYEFHSEIYTTSLIEIIENGETLLPYKLDFYEIEIGEYTFLIDLSCNYI